MRFLLRWQHVAPGSQLAGEQGLVAVLGQLQGFEAAAVAWEPELVGRRLLHYEPGWLDRLCHDGDVAWLRLTVRARTQPDNVAVAPSKATPIAVVFRTDLVWLLAASRSATDQTAPDLGATAEILEQLRAQGACFATDLASATHRLPDDVERGLWDGVARGLIMCDGFGAIRARVNGGWRPSASPTLSRLTRGVRATRVPGAAGRWSLVPKADETLETVEPDADHDDVAEAVAEQLLNRWGVVFRDLAVHDSLRLPWREIQWALRRLEDRGLVRGGRFVTGFTGEQYALPAAVDQLNHARKQARTGERVVVNATDPLNLVGVVVPGTTIPAVRTNQVVYVDGVAAAPD
jgi:ATP-dependent Lhr-like helicase